MVWLSKQYGGIELWPTLVGMVIMRPQKHVSLRVKKEILHRQVITCTRMLGDYRETSITPRGLGLCVRFQYTNIIISCFFSIC